MIAVQAKTLETAAKIRGMSTYINDSTGARIAWARKQKKWTGHDLARAVGVRNIYISQIENNHRRPALPMMQQLATALGVTVGFLLMETDEPYHVSATAQESEPVYFSPEADAAAQLIDAAPPGERARMLAVLRAMIDTAQASEGEQTISADKGNKRVTLSRDSDFASRLIHRDKVVQPHTSERTGS